MKDLSDCRVLIVDATRANVDILVHALQREYQLSVALDGEAALRSGKAAPPDLILPSRSRRAGLPSSPETSSSHTPTA